MKLYLILPLLLLPFIVWMKAALADSLNPQKERRPASSANAAVAEPLNPQKETRPSSSAKAAVAEPLNPQKESRPSSSAKAAVAESLNPQKETRPASSAKAGWPGFLSDYSRDSISLWSLGGTFATFAGLLIGYLALRLTYLQMKHATDAAERCNGRGDSGHKCGTMRQPKRA